MGRTSEEAKEKAIKKWRQRADETRAQSSDLAAVCAAQDKLATRLETRVLTLRHEHSGLTVQLGEANERLQQLIDSRNGLKEATYTNATRLDELRMLEEVEQALTL